MFSIFWGLILLASLGQAMPKEDFMKMFGNIYGLCLFLCFLSALVGGMAGEFAGYKKDYPIVRSRLGDWFSKFKKK